MNMKTKGECFAWMREGYAWPKAAAEKAAWMEIRARSGWPKAGGCAVREADCGEIDSRHTVL
jgi:hypothetical protein